MFLKIFLQLERPSDGATSEPLPFEYYPDPGMQTKINHTFCAYTETIESIELSKVVVDPDERFITEFISLPDSSSATQMPNFDSYIPLPKTKDITLNDLNVPKSSKREIPLTYINIPLIPYNKKSAGLALEKPIKTVSNQNLPYNSNAVDSPNCKRDSKKPLVSIKTPEQSVPKRTTSSINSSYKDKNLGIPSSSPAYTNKPQFLKDDIITPAKFKENNLNKDKNAYKKHVSSVPDKSKASSTSKTYQTPDKKEHKSSNVTQNDCQKEPLDPDRDLISFDSPEPVRKKLANNLNSGNSNSK